MHSAYQTLTTTLVGETHLLARRGAEHPEVAVAHIGNQVGIPRAGLGVKHRVWVRSLQPNGQARALQRVTAGRVACARVSGECNPEAMALTTAAARSALLCWRVPALLTWQRGAATVRQPRGKESRLPLRRRRTRGSPASWRGRARGEAPPPLTALWYRYRRAIHVPGRAGALGGGEGGRGGSARERCPVRRRRAGAGW